jgi:site-specific DNA recombinase
MVGTGILWHQATGAQKVTDARVRCALYTRKSSEEGLDQSFNSLHAQREACEAYVLSQKHEGWEVLPAHYDDGGFSGGNMERPGLKQLLADIAAGKIDTVVVYKVDRLTRSLSDFARIVESFDSKGASFVSVTQQFNTTSSMGRLTLNVLLSFAQFEREVTGERIRDKVAASKKKGMWMGGLVPLGYDLDNHQLIINREEATTVRRIFNRYLKLRSVTTLQEELKNSGIRSKRHVSLPGRVFGGAVLSRGTLYHLLSNPIYIGKTAHKGVLYPGKHERIIDADIWQQTHDLLKTNAVVRRNRKNLPSGRMLHVKLATENGVLYTPTHAAKGGRRYCYYTLTRKEAVHSKTDIRRLPAVEIESRVLACIAALLADSIRLAKHYPKLPVRDTKLLTSAARHMATTIAEGSIKEKSEFLRKVLTRVLVFPSELRLELDRAALGQELLNGTPPSEATGSIVLQEPFQLARRGSEVRLILESREAQLDECIPSLVRVVSQAKAWYEWIVNGEICRMRELAKRAALNRHYTSRIFPLVNLSPQLTEAVLKGDHPPTLTVAQLTAEVAMDWSRQQLSERL